MERRGYNKDSKGETVLSWTLSGSLERCNTRPDESRSAFGPSQCGFGCRILDNTQNRVNTQGGGFVSSVLETGFVLNEMADRVSSANSDATSSRPLHEE